MEDPKINELRWACQLAKYQDKNYKDAYLIFQEAWRKAMDRRKFNKPILIKLEEKDGLILEGYPFVYLERKWKKYRIGAIDYFNEWLPGIETITILTNHLHRSSYYRVRRLANEIQARLIVPSSCIVDK